MTEHLKYFGDITTTPEEGVFDAFALLNDEHVDLVLYNLTNKKLTENHMSNLRNFLDNITENANLSLKAIVDSFRQKSKAYDFIQLQKILLSDSSSKILKKCNKSISIEECLLSNLKLFEITIHYDINENDELFFHFCYSVEDIEPALTLVMTEDKKIRILEIEE